MVVGPEAAGSLLTGNVVRDSIKRGSAHDQDDLLHGQIASVVTGVAGAILTVAGGARLGFLDNVLSRPFLRGFICAIGIVILIDQLIPEMGLTLRQREVGDEHGSTWDKVLFLAHNVRFAHGLTSAVSFGSFAIIMVCRYGTHERVKQHSILTNWTSGISEDDFSRTIPKLLTYQIGLLSFCYPQSSHGNSAGTQRVSRYSVT